MQLIILLLKNDLINFMRKFDKFLLQMKIMLFKSLAQMKSG